jgi:hypothetical protein
VLSFDLHNGVLKESFDDLKLSYQQIFALNSWDDDETIPAPLGSNQPPQATNIPLFHDQLVMAVANPDGDEAGVFGGGTTSYQGLPRQTLFLYDVNDTITFPGVASKTEAVTIADLDFERLAGTGVSVMFVGANGTETLTDPTPATSNLPPYVVTSSC